jgi:hypothetical protein
MYLLFSHTPPTKDVFTSLYFKACLTVFIANISSYFWTPYWTTFYSIYLKMNGTTSCYLYDSSSTTERHMK